MKEHDANNGGVTLKDIVFHIQGVQKSMRGTEKRLSDRIDGNSKGILSNAHAIGTLEYSMHHRFHSLEEDLYATMYGSYPSHLIASIGLKSAAFLAGTIPNSSPTAKAIPAADSNAGIDSKNGT